MADSAGRQGLAGVVDDGGDMSGYRPSHRTGLDRHDARIRTEHEVALGLAEHFVDRHLEHLSAPLEQFFADRLATGIDRAKIDAEPPDRIGHLTHQP